MSEAMHDEGMPVRQRFAVGFVVENGAEHLRLGMELIGRPDLVHERSAPILTLLAFGTELLLKSTWVAAVVNRTGTPPQLQELKGAGHHVLRLHSKVVEEGALLVRERAAPGVCDLDTAMRWRDADLAWMRDDRNLRAVLQVLDDYGYGRYTDFAVIVEGSAGTDPREDWERAIQSMWETENSEVLAEIHGRNDTTAYLELSKNYDAEAAALIRQLLGNYYRNISRWWWSGLLGENPRVWSGCLQQFLK